ncbi:MAG: hypothetical protein ABEJ86_02595 [Halococcoides sp.]
MSAPESGDPIDEMLGRRDPSGWDSSYNKKQCPECGGLHGETAATCSVCGWAPGSE